MGQYRSKPCFVEAFTFEELVQYGINAGANIVDGMPWSFDFRGYPITHEDDHCYLVPSRNETQYFTHRDMLVVDEDNNLLIFKRDEFLAMYEPAFDQSNSIN